MMHRLPEEDDILDGVDRTPQHFSVEVLSDVTDGMLVRLRDGVRVLIDATPIAEQDKSRLLELEAEIRSIDLLEEPQVTLFEESVGSIGDSGDRRKLLHV
jgi:hypothetical protein